MIVTYSGIRDICSESEAVVYSRVFDDAQKATEFRFGGALGVDTIALEAAYRFDMGAKRRVFVPSTLAAQPKEARKAIEKFADEVIELGLPRGEKWTYLVRNKTMIAGSDVKTKGKKSDVLVAFKDSRWWGGTHAAILDAIELGVPHQVVEVFARLDPTG